MSRLEGYDVRFVDVKGVRIRLALAPAPETEPKRSLVLLGGRSEFVEKYTYAIADLRALGFHVATLDWRGQGASDRLLADRVRGHVGDFRDFQADLDALFDFAGERLPAPWFGFAHSMGALIMTERLVSEPGRFGKVVLSAPFFGLRASPLELRFLPPVVRLARALGLGGRMMLRQVREPALPDDMQPDVLTTDAERFLLYRELGRELPDHLIGGVTIGWVAAALDALDRLARPGALEGITTPVLVLKAGNERVVDAAGAERFAARMPHARLIDYPGAEHEILWEKEPIRSAALGEIDAFLR